MNNLKISPSQVAELSLEGMHMLAEYTKSQQCPVDNKIPGAIFILVCGEIFERISNEMLSEALDSSSQKFNITASELQALLTGMVSDRKDH